MDEDKIMDNKIKVVDDEVQIYGQELPFENLRLHFSKIEHLNHTQATNELVELQ